MLDYQFPFGNTQKTLEGKVEQHYLEKISTIGIHPVLIEEKHFEPDCLPPPPVESTDLLYYLVLETCFYSQLQFNAFRSLEAYNQMISGFAQCIEGHSVAGKFAVLVKLQHSQRLNSALISVWIITENDCTII